jgi:hypothetical protein
MAAIKEDVHEASDEPKEKILKNEVPKPSPNSDVEKLKRSLPVR